MKNNYILKDLWNKRYGNETEVYDYSGRKMEKSAIGNQSHPNEPTIDHIRPISNGGKDVEGNIEICNRITNQEKGDSWPHWVTNGKRFKGQRTTGDGYEIVTNE